MKVWRGSKRREGHKGDPRKKNALLPGGRRALITQCKQDQRRMSVRIELVLNPAMAEKLGVKKTTWV